MRNDRIAQLTDTIIAGRSIDPDELLELVLNAELDILLEKGDIVRRHFRGDSIELCSIINARSGRCSENCAYCAQSVFWNTGCPEYPLLSSDEILRRAMEIEFGGVGRLSLVTSGRRLNEADLKHICDIFNTLREKTDLRLCASLGLLSREEAKRLRKSGVERYHNNLETGPGFFHRICTTHTFEDKVRTIEIAKEAGMEICSGGIIGMGETMRDRMEMALELRRMNVRSVPVNILTPIPGTPLEGRPALSSEEILRTCVLFRFLLPQSRIRYAGGRKTLGNDQKRGLRGGVNAILTGNYLTTAGNGIDDDRRMILSLGLDIANERREVCGD